MNERSRELIGYIDVNSKIRELAEQSGCKIDKLGYGEGNLEKFAELIIEECRYVMDCNKGRDQNPEWNRALSETSKKIKEHFGVE